MSTEKSKCICLEDNKLTQALCPIHSTPVPAPHKDHVGKANEMVSARKKHSIYCGTPGGSCSCPAPKQNCPDCQFEPENGHALTCPNRVPAREKKCLYSEKTLCYSQKCGLHIPHFSFQVNPPAEKQEADSPSVPTAFVEKQEEKCYCSDTIFPHLHSGLNPIRVRRPEVLTPEQDEAERKQNDCMVNPPAEKQEAEGWRTELRNAYITFVPENKDGLSDKGEVFIEKDSLEDYISYLLTQTRKEAVAKREEEILEKIRQYRCFPDEQHCTCMEALKDFLSTNPNEIETPKPRKPNCPSCQFENGKHSLVCPLKNKDPKDYSYTVC